MRVIPDVPAIDKTFDYAVPDGERGADALAVGTMVRVDLHGRRVGGWVEAVDVEPAAGVTLRPLSKVSGIGPTAELVDLARWAAWRWAGALATILRTASPPRMVAQAPGPRPAARPTAPATSAAELADEVLRAGGGVVRLPPGADRMGVLLAAAARGPVLVIAPARGDVRVATQRLRDQGVRVAEHPEDWALGFGGATVVGTRAAAWAPVEGLAAIVVLDEHDEALQQEQAPTWHARDVAIERARRLDIPCVLVSPCPTLEAQAWAPAAVAPSRGEEREGWPVLQVIDRRAADPREGLWSPELLRALREDGRRALCVLNRTGRSSLLACAACGEIASCERCGAAVRQPADGVLRCPRCEAERPRVCLACGGLKMKALRIGVSRARDELETLLGEPVAEVTGSTTGTEVMGAHARVLIGTEAVLHQAGRADVVAFLEIDQELLAARYRASEQALGLLARAARVVGGRRRGGRVLVQTRMPQHEVLRAALHGDPAAFADDEAARRALLAMPPAFALAVVSGAGADAFIDALGSPLGVDVSGPSDTGQWLLRAADHEVLCDALAATPRPGGRLRIEVDPLRV